MISSLSIILIPNKATILKKSHLHLLDYQTLDTQSIIRNV